MFKFPDVARVTINRREVKGIVERAFSCIKEAAKLVAQIMQLAREAESMLRNQPKRQQHRLDLTRAKMQHQVLCRKPRHLVKKII